MQAMSGINRVVSNATHGTSPAGRAYGACSGSPTIRNGKITFTTDGALALGRIGIGAKSVLLERVYHRHSATLFIEVIFDGGIDFTLGRFGDDFGSSKGQWL